MPVITPKYKLRDVLILVNQIPSAMIEVQASWGPSILCRPDDIEFSGKGSLCTLNSPARLIVEDRETWEASGVIGQIEIEVTATVKQETPFMIGFDTRNAGKPYQVVLPFRVLHKQAERQQAEETARRIEEDRTTRPIDATQNI